MLAKRERVANAQPLVPAFQISDIANVKAERAVIASVFHQPDLFPVLDEIVQPQDFFTLFNGMIWHSFGEITANNMLIDLITVGDVLEKRGMNDTVRLVELTTGAPTLDNAENYARMVRDAGVKIRILKAGCDIVTHVMQNRLASVEELTDESNRLLFNATEQRGETESSLMSIAHSEMNRIEGILNGEAVQGIETGFDNLNRLLHVYAPGELVILAGSEGMGKTTMLLSQIRRLLKAGKRILLFTLEMSKEEIVRVLTAMESMIPKDVLKTGSLSQIQWADYVKAMGIVSTWNLHVIDEYPALTPLQLRRKLRKLIATEGGAFDMICVDGLWLMEATEPTKERPRDVFLITRDLIEIGRNFAVPVIITHQYNADIKGADKPSVFHLAESAAVRRNAQIIIGLWRDSYYGIASDRDVTKGYLLKDRNGTAQGKSVEYTFLANYNRYEELAS